MPMRQRTASRITTAISTRIALCARTSIPPILKSIAASATITASAIAPASSQSTAVARNYGMR